MSHLRQLLDVQQNPKHHPEGKVFTHCRLVRKCLDEAIACIQNQIWYEPFSRFPSPYYKRERNILRFAAWLHDIGKGSASEVVDGEVKSIGHEEIPHLIAGFRKLRSSPLWHRMWKRSSKEDRRELFFIIRYHMDRLGKKFQNRWINEQGQYDPSLKLLFTFMVMDRMGRAMPRNPHPCGLMFHAASDKKKRWAKQNDKPNEPDNPQDFCKYLKDKGLQPPAIQAALKGKRAKGLDNFQISDQEIDQLTLQ